MKYRPLVLARTYRGLVASAAESTSRVGLIYSANIQVKTIGGLETINMPYEMFESGLLTENEWKEAIMEIISSGDKE